MRHALPALLTVFLAVGALFVAAPTTAPESRNWAGLSEDALFFSMQIADETGAILAEPKLLGMLGVPLQMSLVERGKSSRSRMDLRLEPEANRDGSYAVSFELSVPGKVSRGRGSMTLRAGEEQSASVDYPGGRIELQLVAFTVPSPEFDLFLRHGIRLQDRARHT